MLMVKQAKNLMVWEVVPVLHDLYQMLPNHES